MEVATGFAGDIREVNREEPSLSVIIAAYRAGPLLDNCLESLRSQQTREPFEVIVVDSGNEEPAPRLSEAYPGIRVILSRQRMYCGEARNHGIELALGPILVFLDADCTVPPDWVESVLEAHRAPCLLVGGAVLNGSPRDTLAWAYYFCEFNLWLPGNSGWKEIKEAAGCCLSMKREAFNLHGPFLEGTYCSDTAFQWKVNRAGRRVLFSPRIRVFHSACHDARSFLEHIVEHRRCFARVCLQQGQIGEIGALLWLLGGPLVPLLVLPVISWRVIRAGGLLSPFLRSLPWVAAGSIARAFGEMRGIWDCLVTSSPHPGPD
jgi:GT2 family glycosyltransferase